MKTFDEWHKTHGPNTEELWYIQNCLGDILGWDNENTKQAMEAWKNSSERESL